VPAFGEISPSPGDTLKQVEPKSLWNYEVGARGLLEKRFLYDASVFFSDIDNEFVPVDNNGVAGVENAGSSRNIGIELSLLTNVTRWLDVLATYTFSDFRLLDYTPDVRDSTGASQPVDMSGNLLPAVPQNRVTLGLDIRPMHGLSVGVRVEWQSQMFVDSENSESGTVYFKRTPTSPVVPVAFSAVPPRTLVELNAHYQAGVINIFGTIENLFGITYVGNVVANAVNGAFYEAGPGRWVSVGVRVGLR
jgi:outer membrane receptor for Fe3+-dicitrate